MKINIRILLYLEKKKKKKFISTAVQYKKSEAQIC